MPMLIMTSVKQNSDMGLVGTSVDKLCFCCFRVQQGECTCLAPTF